MQLNKQVFTRSFKVQEPLILFKKKNTWLSESEHWYWVTKRKTKVSHIQKDQIFPAQLLINTWAWNSYRAEKRKSELYFVLLVQCTKVALTWRWGLRTRVSKREEFKHLIIIINEVTWSLCMRCTYFRTSRHYKKHTSVLIFQHLILDCHPPLNPQIIETNFRPSNTSPLT